MAKVTRLPHDGRMILGGKGSLTPFNPNQTSSSGAKPQSTVPGGDMSDPEVAAKTQAKVGKSILELNRKEVMVR